MKDISNEKPAPGLEEFVLEFLEDRLSEFQTLNESFSKKDFEGLRAMAHKWKGFCAPYGFNYLEVLSIKLEELASNKNSSEVDGVLNDISQYLGEKEKILKD